MKTKHTPGEWTRGVNTSTKKWMQIFCNGKLIAEAKPLNKIGERQPNDFAEEEANAKLISASPELLLALIEIAEAKGTYSLDRLQHAENTIKDMVLLAKQAIDKATN